MLEAGRLKICLHNWGKILRLLLIFSEKWKETKNSLGVLGIIFERKHVFHTLGKS